MSTAPAPVSAPEAIITLWRRHRHAVHARRCSAADLPLLRRQLGALLAAKRDQLARPGCGGDFHAWLREADIPRATAYRLIAVAAKPVAPPRPRPAVELKKLRLTVQLDPKSLALIRRALALAQQAAAAASQTEIRPPLPLILQNYLLRCAPEPLRAQLKTLAARHPDDFRRDRAAALTFTA